MKRHLFILTTALVVAILLLGGCSSTTPAPQSTSPASASTSTPAAAPASTPAAAPASAPASTPAVAPASAAAPAKTYNWKMTSPFPPGLINRPILQFAKTLEQRTNGAVKITVYESTLGAPTDAWDMTKSNSVQLTMTGDAMNPGRMPISAMIGLPFELSNPEVGTLVAYEWSKAGYLKELNDNFKVLYFQVLIPQSMFLRDKKVTTMDDFKGLKIRSATAMMGQVLGALGATPITMSAGEVYMAQDRGVIDANITGVNGAIDRKIYEVSKYGMNLPLPSGMLILLMNKETWNSLPPDLQKTIEQISQDVSSSDIKMSMEEERSYWETIGKKIEVYTISPEEQARWRKAVAVVTDKYVQETAAKGHPAKEALELMRKVVANYKK